MSEYPESLSVDRSCFGTRNQGSVPIVRPRSFRRDRDRYRARHGSGNGLGVAARKLYEEGYRHPACVLNNLATEEAAKVLVLVDAVRCPRNKSTEKSRTLGYFYDHLAKGIYAAVNNWSPADFADVMHGIDP